MTVAIAVPLKKRIILGADSRCTTGSKLSGTVSKIHRIGSAAVVGAGSLGAVQATVSAAVSERVQTAQEFAALARQVHGSDETEWLWAGPDGLWEVDGQGGAVQMFEPCSVGSGGQYALGVLAGKGPLKGKTQVSSAVLDALELTGAAFVDCGAPYEVVLV